MDPLTRIIAIVSAFIILYLVSIVIIKKKSPRASKKILSFWGIAISLILIGVLATTVDNFFFRKDNEYLPSSRELVNQISQKLGRTERPKLPEENQSSYDYGKREEYPTSSQQQTQTTTSQKEEGGGWWPIGKGNVTKPRDENPINSKLIEPPKAQSEIRLPSNIEEHYLRIEKMTLLEKQCAAFIENYGHRTPFQLDIDQGSGPWTYTLRLPPGPSPAVIQCAPIMAKIIKVNRLDTVEKNPVQPENLREMGSFYNTARVIFLKAVKNSGCLGKEDINYIISR